MQYEYFYFYWHSDSNDAMFVQPSQVPTDFLIIIIGWFFFYVTVSKTCMKVNKTFHHE